MAQVRAFIEEKMKFHKTLVFVEQLLFKYMLSQVSTQIYIDYAVDRLL